VKRSIIIVIFLASAVVAQSIKSDSIYSADSLRNNFLTYQLTKVDTFFTETNLALNLHNRAETQVDFAVWRVRAWIQKT